MVDRPKASSAKWEVVFGGEESAGLKIVSIWAEISGPSCAICLYESISFKFM